MTSTTCACSADPATSADVGGDSTPETAPSRAPQDAAARGAVSGFASELQARLRSGAEKLDADGLTREARAYRTAANLVIPFLLEDLDVECRTVKVAPECPRPIRRRARPEVPAEPAADFLSER